MARPRKLAAAQNGQAPAGAGHNKAPLTEDEAGALTTHFALKILADQKIVAMKKADFENAKNVVNGHFKMVSKELGITRKDFEAEVVGKLGMSEAEYKHFENKRNRLHRLAGLKSGDQIDLIAHVLPDTIDDAMNAEADGYRAGRRADDPELPSHISSMFTTDWLNGWHGGQAYNATQLGKAEDILARPVAGTMAPVGLDPGEDDDGSPEALAAAADRLKDTGWVGPTEAEEEFEAADNGRTVRKPRAKATAGAEEQFAAE